MVKFLIALLLSLFLIATADHGAEESQPIMLDGIESICCMMDNYDPGAEFDPPPLGAIASLVMLLVPFPVLLAPQRRYCNPDPLLPLRPPRA